MEWKVVTEPIGANPALKPEAAQKRGRKRLTGSKEEQDKDNVGGIIVSVQKGGQKHEVARVGFVRATSENPNDSFDDKLDEVIAIAQKSADELNTHTVDGDLL